MIYERSRGISGRGNKEFYVIGTSNSNSFYPVYIYGDGSVRDEYTEVIANGEIWLYYKILPHRTDSFNYSKLFEVLKTSISGSVFTIRYKESTVEIKVAKGYIADSENNILMLLCRKSRQLHSSSGHYEEDDLTLFIAHEFINNTDYINIYRRLYKDYINIFHEKGIDIIMKTSAGIEKSVFNNDFVIESNSLTELSNMIDNYIPSEREQEVLNLETTEQSSTRLSRRTRYRSSEGELDAIEGGHRWIRDLERLEIDPDSGDLNTVEPINGRLQEPYYRHTNQYMRMSSNTPILGVPSEYPYNPDGPHPSSHSPVYRVTPRLGRGVSESNQISEIEDDGIDWVDWDSLDIAEETVEEDLVSGEEYFDINGFSAGFEDEEDEEDEVVSWEIESDLELRHPSGNFSRLLDVNMEDIEEVELYGALLRDLEGDTEPTDPGEFGEENFEF